MTAQPAILVFDSGLGGLTVFREVVKARPDARFVYAADDAFFPYGSHAEPVLVARVVAVMGELSEAHRPDLVVVACNTASVQALAELRKNFQVPFVGTVPAIKPACSTSNSKLVSVLGTEATVKREYTRALIREHGNNCEVTLVGSPRLASFAEQELNGEPASDQAVLAEIAPCFIEAGGRRTDSIVLACTHYPLVLHRFEQLAPWPVRYIDQAPAIARRVLDLLGPPMPGAKPFRRERFSRRDGRPLRRWQSSDWPKTRPCAFDTPGLTLQAFAPKYPSSRGPFGPRGVSRPAVLPVLAAEPVGSGQVLGQRRARSSKPAT